MVTSDTVLDALGNGTRRSIVRILAGGPLSVGGIAGLVPVSRPAVSQHLRVLEQAELVRFTEEGTRNLYELDQAGFLAARAWLDAFWSESLTNFAALAESSFSPPTVEEE